MEQECDFCRNHATLYFNVAGIQGMHMQVKPAQTYFTHEKKKKCTNTEERQNMISTQDHVITIIVHPNFWIGTLRDKRIQNLSSYLGEAT